MTKKEHQRILGLKDFLDCKAEEFNHLGFIGPDPISIPHQYQKKQDIEIAGLLAAVLAWGQRITVINKSNELLALMGNAPHDFLLNHQARDLKPFGQFKHRTFNATDVHYFIMFLSQYYKSHTSLEDAFLVSPFDPHVGNGLAHFHRLFFSLPNYPQRTLKHLATPERKSACKRINMYLRWMVRTDKNGVDFGLWKKISPAQLICPLDLHVERVARKLRLVSRKQIDWETAIELTNHLKLLDPHDPVKYDFALFGLGIMEKF